MGHARLRVLSVALLGVGLLLGAIDLRAHELGTIRTYADFRRDGSYSIEVFIDREHLPPGFASGAVRSKAPIQGLSASLESAPVGRTLAEVANHSTVFFDGGAVEPRRSWKNPDPAAAEAILLFAGSIPPGSHSFVWKNTLPLGTYLLTIHTE